VRVFVRRFNWKALVQQEAMTEKVDPKKLKVDELKDEPKKN
jgi:hypothetical protein